MIIKLMNQSTLQSICTILFIDFRNIDCITQSVDQQNAYHSIDWHAFYRMCYPQNVQYTTCRMRNAICKFDFNYHYLYLVECTGCCEWYHTICVQYVMEDKCAIMSAFQNA